MLRNIRVSRWSWRKLEQINSATVIYTHDLYVRVLNLLATLFRDYAARYLSLSASVVLTLELLLPRLYNRAPRRMGEASVDFPRPSTYPVADDEWIRFRGCWISNAIPATTIYPVFSCLRYHHTGESTFPPPIIAAAALVAPRYSSFAICILLYFLFFIFGWYLYDIL